MSGFLGQIAGSTATLMTALPALLSEFLGAAEGATGGGLPVLIAQFENAGLGDKVRSWLGPDHNEPITPDEVASIIPLERRESWAKETGVTLAQLDQLLAHVLPELIDHASPEGKVTTPNAATFLEKFYNT